MDLLCRWVATASRCRSSDTFLAWLRATCAATFLRMSRPLGRSWISRLGLDLGAARRRSNQLLEVSGHPLRSHDRLPWKRTLVIFTPGIPRASVPASRAKRVIGTELTLDGDVRHRRVRLGWILFRFPVPLPLQSSANRTIKRSGDRWVGATPSALRSNRTDCPSVLRRRQLLGKVIEAMSDTRHRRWSAVSAFSGSFVARRTRP